MRKSNTEPIIRIYAESGNEKTAHDLGERFVERTKKFDLIIFENYMKVYFRQCSNNINC
jgi:hypothetical protein